MPDQNLRQVKRVLWVILFANLAVAGVKIIAGELIASASLTADGFHSLTDGISNIVGLIGIQFAAQPLDGKHPYGHRKYEHLTGLFIGFMLLLIGGFVIHEAFDKFMNPAVPDITTESLVALIGTLFVNLYVCIYEYRQGQKLGSPILVSDSLHTRSDVYVSLSVLATLIGIKFGLPAVIDPIASLVVAAFILHAAAEIIRSTSDVLVDKAVVTDTELIREIAFSFPEVKDIHNIRSRGSEQELYIDMHLLVDPTMELATSHRLSHEIEREIRRRLQAGAHVMIHMEPFRKG